MKLSVEAKVAAGVAVAFAALSVGVIAQEQGEHRSVGVSQMSPNGAEISLAVHNGSEENQLLAQY